MIPKRSYISQINFSYHNIYDTTAARRDLNFKYTIPFDEGARRVVLTLLENNRIENYENDPTDDLVITAWEKMSHQLVNELKSLDS